MIGRREIEAALVAYVRAVWGADSAGKVIRSNEPGERPPLPYVAISVLADAPAGSPSVSVEAREVDEDGFDLDEVSRQDRIVTVAVHVFGRSALDVGLAEALDAARALAPGRALIVEHGVAILDASPIVDVSALRGSTAIERHFSIDFRCHAVRISAPRAIVSASSIQIETEIVGGHETPDTATESHPAEVPPT